MKKLFNFALKLLNYKLLNLSLYNKIIIVENLKKKKIYKISFSKSSNKYISNEYKGYIWYLKKIKKNFSLDIDKRNLYFLKVEKFQGYKVDYHSDAKANQSEIYKVINYYKKIWPSKKIVPVHGDFTLANLIFLKNSKELKIIDWENFKKSGEPWGFDLAYFFLSIAILPNLNKDKIDLEEKKELKKIWGQIKKMIKDKKLSKDPVSYFLNLFEKKSYWKKLNSKFGNKFFLNKANESLLIDIKKTIN